MISVLSMTQKVLTLQIIFLVLGGCTAVLAVVYIIVFIMQATVTGLHLLAGYVQETGALLASMPALHFLYLLALACLVSVVAVKLVLWAARSIRMEVRNYVTK